MKYTLLESSLNWDSKNVKIIAKGATREKLFWESLKSDGTYQLQLNMLLLLYPWEDLLKISFEAISELTDFLYLTLVQKISWVKVECQY